MIGPRAWSLSWNRPATFHYWGHLATEPLRNSAGVGQRFLPARETVRKLSGHAARDFLEWSLAVHQFERAAMQQAFRGKIGDTVGRLLMQCSDGERGPLELRLFEAERGIVRSIGR